MKRPDFALVEHMDFLDSFDAGGRFTNATSALAKAFGLTIEQADEIVRYQKAPRHTSRSYSFIFDDTLRQDYEQFAVDAGVGVTLKDMVVKALEIAKPVLEAGHDSLETYCVDREQGATADYLECPDA